MSSGDQSLKKSDEGSRIHLRQSVSVLGCLAAEDPGCGPPRGRRKRSGWEEDCGHGSCLDSRTGKNWAQIQTPLTESFGYIVGGLYTSISTFTKW